MIDGPLKYLCIGHICHDQSNTDITLGGTPVFARPWLNSFGFRCSLITSYGSDFKFSEWPEQMDCNVLPAKRTTVFENKYENQSRIQYLREKATIIKASDVQKSDLHAEIIHFCPIADEVDLDILEILSPQQFAVATPQGWLRKSDHTGRIRFTSIDWKKLRSLKALVISEEDVPDLSTVIPEVLVPDQLFVVTKGENGSFAYFQDHIYFFPAFPLYVKNLTGLGDVFSAVLFAQYFKTNDLKQSMIIATCAASLHAEFGSEDEGELTDLLSDRVNAYQHRYRNFNYQP